MPFWNHLNSYVRKVPATCQQDDMFEDTNRYLCARNGRGGPFSMIHFVFFCPYPVIYTRFPR
jgi:hypothetical protein